MPTIYIGTQKHLRGGVVDERATGMIEDQPGDRAYIQLDDGEWLDCRKSSLAYAETAPLVRNATFVTQLRHRPLETACCQAEIPVTEGWNESLARTPCPSCGRRIIAASSMTANFFGEVYGLTLSEPFLGLPVLEMWDAELLCGPLVHVEDNRTPVKAENELVLDNRTPRQCGGIKTGEAA